MTVSCKRCGDTWDRDPALEVKCPTCDSRVGSYCCSPHPSGHHVKFGIPLIHAARDQLAMDKGFLKPCVAAIVSPVQPRQLSLL